MAPMISMTAQVQAHLPLLSDAKPAKIPPNMPPTSKSVLNSPESSGLKVAEEERIYKHSK